MARVFCAMSGGVDSSVAAALLLEQGHEVTGVTMQLWPSSDAEDGCCSVSAIRDARRVCDLLGIAHYSLNYREVFEREVVGPFAEEYAAGRTPNPCIVCNDRVKFSDLLAKVATQGAEYLATGHYARIVERGSTEPWLATGWDSSKDQSYFLYRLTEQQMRHVLFPVGELHKSDVRAIAGRKGLAVADKPESQETCFAVKGSYVPAIARRAPSAMIPGSIVDTAGREVGHHDGVAHYTVGQRKGIGVGGLDEPLYVVRIEAERHTVIVGPRKELESTTVVAGEAIWRGPSEMRVRAAVRYRMVPLAATACADVRGRLTVTFDEPLLAVAPGQSIVCYDSDVVVGGGIIECAS